MKAAASQVGLIPDGIEVFAAIVAAFLLGSRFGIPGPMDLGLVVALFLIPVWLSRISSGIRIIGLLGSVAILSGLMLDGLASATHDVSNSQTIGQIVLILRIVVGSATLYWVKQVVGPVKMALSFGVGMLLMALIRGVPSSENLWKFHLFLPVSVIALSLAWGGTRTRRNELIAMVGLILISAVSDTRSTAAIMGTALLIQMWTLVRVLMRLRSTPTKVAAGLAFIGLVSYSAMQAFLLEGFLGEGAQQRSQAQIETGGSLLTGGRPEMGASVALIKNRPWGYGIGTQPSAEDIFVAKSGMASLNYDPDNGYVHNYMFGNGFEVHSVLGDLWIRFGVFGMLLLAGILVIVLSGSLSALAANQARALTTFLTVQCFWEAMFSPLWTTSINILILAVALLAGPAFGDVPRETQIGQPLGDT